MTFAEVWGYHVSAVNTEPNRVPQENEGNPLSVDPLHHPLTFRWLSQILNRVQRHRCQTIYCLRKKKGSTEHECRFFFPRQFRDTAALIQREGTSWWIFEAERNDQLMNHYVRAVSLGWLANIDFSPCTSLQAVINYAGKYCSKSEKKTESYSKLAAAVLPKISHTNPMVSFASKFI